MQNYLQYLVFLGAIVQLIGIFSYIKDTLKGKTKPNKITWLMWSIAPMIATVAALSSGVGISILPVFMSGFGPFLVFISSLANKNSYWKLQKFDYFCGAFSILALILWIITKNPNIAILFSILSDASAAAPTIIKAWKHPETESINAYTTGLFNIFTGFFAIQTWNFSSLAFSVYLIISNTLITLFIWRGKIQKQKIK